VNRKCEAAHEATSAQSFASATLEQRDKGNVEKILSLQLRGSLKDLGKKELQETVIAYEPIWAIGPAECDAQQAQEAHAFIRRRCARSRMKRWPIGSDSIRRAA